MKPYDAKLCGQSLCLLLNAQALFDLYDRFGADKFLTDHIEGTDKASFEATCAILSKLAEQGELWRRWQGLDRRPVLTEGWFRAHLAPFDVADAKEAIVQAVRLGFEREERADEPDMDLGLMELQKKTAPTG